MLFEASSVIVGNTPPIMDFDWVAWVVATIGIIAGLIFGLVGVGCYFEARLQSQRDFGATFMKIGFPVLAVSLAAGFIFLAAYNTQTSNWEERTAELLGRDVTVEQVVSAEVIHAVRKNSISRLELPEGYRYSSEEDKYIAEDRIFMVDGYTVSMLHKSDVPEIPDSAEKEDTDKEEE